MPISFLPAFCIGGIVPTWVPIDRPRQFSFELFHLRGANPERMPQATTADSVLSARRRSVHPSSPPGMFLLGINVNHWLAPRTCVQEGDCQANQGVTRTFTSASHARAHWLVRVVRRRWQLELPVFAVVHFESRRSHCSAKTPTHRLTRLSDWSLVYRS